MYIELQPIFDKYNVHPKGVIHVGAHFAEEHEDYLKCGIERFVYIEPCKDAWATVAKKFNLTNGFLNNRVVGMCNDSIKLYPIACGSKEGIMPMYVSHQNQGQSNSLLKPELHLLQHPDIIFDDAEIVKVIPLDDLPIEKGKYDMLVMDVQGYEGEVIKGAIEILQHIKIIYTEVNRGQTYKDNKEIDWMDGFLGSFGFARVETFWPSENLTWGDAIYVKVNYKINE